MPGSKQASFIKTGRRLKALEKGNFFIFVATCASEFAKRGCIFM